MLYVRPATHEVEAESPEQDSSDVTPPLAHETCRIVGKLGLENAIVLSHSATAYASKLCRLVIFLYLSPRR